MEMRVLFLASYFPKPGNPEMGTWALSQAQALARQEIELLVVSCTSKVPTFLAQTSGARAYAHCPATYTWPGGVQVRYPSWTYYPIEPFKTWAFVHPQAYLTLAYWSIHNQLQKIIRDFKPDILFCNHSLPDGWIASHFASRYNIPLITLDHDYYEILACDRFPHRYSAMQFVAERAWAMLAVSKNMENHLKRLFPKTHILTQHNGIDPISLSLFQKQRPEKLSGKKVILSCAFFAERKGIPLLIESFCSIAPKHPDTLLRIIGSGPDQEKIQEAVTLHDLAQQVQLIGKKTHQEVLQEMVWADFFALTGWDEPFATVYLEAMAAGKPIICCNDGGITDVVFNQIHGLVVPPKDFSAAAAALDSMLTNDIKRIEMGHNCQQLVQHELTWDAQISKLLNLFKLAIA